MRTACGYDPIARGSNAQTLWIESALPPDRMRKLADPIRNVRAFVSAASRALAQAAREPAGTK
jgi:hypothetical protein